MDVFGVDCFAGSLEDATALVLETARRRDGGYACLCNVHVLETAQRDAAVMAALGNAQVVFPTVPRSRGSSGDTSAGRRGASVGRI